MPQRRATDFFNPEAVPKDLKEYRERTWYSIQMIEYQVSRINGTQEDHNKRIRSLEGTIKGGKIAIGVLGGLGGIGAGAMAFGKRILDWITP